MVPITIFSCRPTVWVPLDTVQCIDCTTTGQGRVMNLSLSIGPLVALIAGILILLVPRLLNYIVAIYLIVIGVIGLVGMK